MTYKWYFIFNRTDFLATGLTSREYDVNMENIGLKTILVTLGNLLGLTYEGIFLPIQMNGSNPFAFDSMAVYVNDDNNVFLGFAIES